MNESKQEVKTVTASATVVDPKTARKSLRKGKEKAAAKFSGSPGLAAFAALVLAEEAKAPAIAATPAKAAKTRAKAAAKPKAVATPAVAPVVVTPFVARLYVKGQAIYALDDISRPVSGRLLLAHTHAALSVLGLLDGKRPAAKKAQLLTLVGQRAVNYHIKNGNLEAAPDYGIRLSILGFNSFNARVKASKIDTAAATAYQSAFLDGKPDSKIGVTKANLYASTFN